MKESINNFYDKNYKKILVIPIILLLFFIGYLVHFYVVHGDIIHKDISLTGGTTITLEITTPAADLQKALSSQISDLEIRSLLDNSGNQKSLVILTSDSPEKVVPLLEDYLKIKLTPANSSVEFTGSSLSQNFYKQLIIAVFIAFFWMAAVVFVIFSHKWKIKVLAIILNILFGAFLGKFFLTLPFIIGITIFLAFIATIVFIYIKYSTPSFAVMFCAFADILMTLAVVDILGMNVSSAGIVAFLMLIGYSVDTDILLTTRVLKRKDTSVNHEIFGSFKTGMTMTLTAIAAIATALIFVYRFQTSLNQIFIILLIGLGFDMLNTWITNTSLIKWFVERQR